MASGCISNQSELEKLIISEAHIEISPYSFPDEVVGYFVCFCVCICVCVYLFVFWRFFFQMKERNTYLCLPYALMFTKNYFGTKTGRETQFVVCLQSNTPACNELNLIFSMSLHSVAQCDTYGKLMEANVNISSNNKGGKIHRNSK